jgi:hypothetical protein
VEEQLQRRLSAHCACLRTSIETGHDFLTTRLPQASWVSLVQSSSPDFLVVYLLRTIAVPRIPMFSAICLEVAALNGGLS